MTIKTSISFLLEALIFILWLFSGELKQKLKVILKDRLSLTFLTLFFINLIGIFWTQNLHEGVQIISKQKIYIFAPLIISFMDRKFIKYALYSFLSAMFISEITSLYIYFTQDIDQFSSLPSPFIHHMHYSLILAFTFGYLINEINFKNIFQKREILYLLFAILTIIVLFINKGRIGQVSLFVVIFVLAIGKFKLSFFKSIMSVIVITTTIFFLAYNISDQFKIRVDRATHEFHEVIGTDKRDSIACRFEMWNYAIKLGEQNPIIGVGTGDSISEMKLLLGEEPFQKLFRECSLGIKYQFNPHNNFLLYFMQFGTIGLLLFILVILSQFKIAYNQNSISMILLISVTLIGMMSTSLITMHIKYMFFYSLILTALYLQSKNREILC